MTKYSFIFSDEFPVEYILPCEWDTPIHTQGRPETLPAQSAEPSVAQTARWHMQYPIHPRLEIITPRDSSKIHPCPVPTLQLVVFSYCPISCPLSPCAGQGAGHGAGTAGTVGSGNQQQETRLLKKAIRFFNHGFLSGTVFCVGGLHPLIQQER